MIQYYIVACAMQQAPQILDKLRTEAAQKSFCTDKQVGAMILEWEAGGRRLKQKSKGFNATSQYAECRECNGHNKKCPATHAEADAVVCLEHSFSARVAIVTLEPCWECTKKLMLAGVIAVLFGEYTNPKKSGAERWRRANVAPWSVWKKV